MRKLKIQYPDETGEDVILFGGGMKNGKLAVRKADSENKAGGT